MIYEKKHYDRINKAGRREKHTCRSRRLTDFRPGHFPHELSHQNARALDVVCRRYQVASLPKATSVMSTQDTVGQDENTLMDGRFMRALAVLHLLEGWNHFIINGQRKERGSIL